MAVAFKNYTIRKNNIEKGFYTGFNLEKTGDITVDLNQNKHIMFLSNIDSGEEDLIWGRLKIEGNIDENAAICIRIFATNSIEANVGDMSLSVEDFIRSKEIALEDKINFYEENDYLACIKTIGQDDIILSSISGRYLWVSIEVIGNNSGTINKISISSPGDIILDMFPEIYQEKGEFFDRYLSIFSSIYVDMEYKIEAVHNNIDIDTAPKELLKVFGQWLGLDMTGIFLEENKLRHLLKNTYNLNKLKGTKIALLELIKILVSEKVIIVERNMLHNFLNSSEMDIYNKLYGKSPYDFTILINKKADERLQSQLLFLLNQFKPIRSKINIVFLSDCASLDSYCYLDINAKMHSYNKGALDDNKAIDGSILLQ